METFSTNCRGIISLNSGAFTVHTSGHDGIISVEDALTIFYTPPDAYFSPSVSTTLSFVGGFNDYSGDEPPLTLPFMPCWDEEDVAKGEYKCNLTVPNFARDIKFAVTDGVRYDSGPSGEMFSIHVTNVQVEGPNSEVLLMHHDPITKEMRRVGVIEKIDPLELERELRSRMENQPEVDVDVNEEEQPETVLTLRDGAEESIRGFMAEADVVGRQLGMGNMEIGEARQAFDKYDEGEEHLVRFEDIWKVLEEVGLDQVSGEEIGTLIDEFVIDLDKGGVGMGEFISIYNKLDQQDEGVDMI